jgi:hypothetical protein
MLIIHQPTTEAPYERGRTRNKMKSNYGGVPDLCLAGLGFGLDEYMAGGGQQLRLHGLAVPPLAPPPCQPAPPL